jgi:leucyl aminopeptidase
VLDVRIASAAPEVEVRPVDTRGTPDQLRAAAGKLARELPAGPAAVACRGLRGDRLASFTEGLVLGAYRFGLASVPPPAPGPVQLVGVDDAPAVERGLRNARATVWARDLANTPAATKTPAWLGAQATRELSPLGVEVTVHDEQWLAANGFGGVLGVGGGSAAPPRLIEASWRPRGARAGVHAVVVGKGITFDTGGINLKRGAGMRTMHTDMSGGAAALAALRTVAELRLPVRVTVLVPAAENSFSGSALRPGDVVRHFGGRTSEIMNTDAEGRIVLADALAYAAGRLRPSVLVDLATLTGAMKVALGLRVGGLFATTDSLAAALVSAGRVSGEPLWRLPLAADYRGTLHSDVADAQNSPGNPGGITAALFLQPFTGGLPWAHLDIAGPARAPEDDGILSRGGTGFGARLIARWVESLG